MVRTVLRKRIRKATYRELQESGFLIFSKIVRNIVGNSWQYAKYLIIPKNKIQKFVQNPMFRKMRSKPPFIEIFYDVDKNRYFIKDMRYEL